MVSQVSEINHVPGGRNMLVQCTSVGFCGLYCGSCPNYLARTQPALRARLAKILNCREEEVLCNGCRELTKACWGYHCKIRLCAEKRGYAYCNQCPHLPCDELKRLSMGHWDMPVLQLRELKGMGELAFLALMWERWICTCGGPISCQTNKCIQCGKEAQDLVPC